MHPYFDGIPASTFGPPAGEAAEEPFPDLPEGLSGRLEVVCLRAIHHSLEYEELYRLLAALRRKAPAAEIRLAVRSALADLGGLAPFSALPVDEVERLTERAGRGTLAAGLRRWRQRLPPDSRRIVLGAPERWRKLFAGWGPPLLALAPLTFRTPGSPGEVTEAGEPASAAFRAALAEAAPRWTVRPGLPETVEPEGSIPRILVHQARFHVGDALWLTPLLAALRHRFPGARTTVVAPRAAEAVFATHKDVAELRFYDGGEPERAALLAGLDLPRFAAALFAFARRPESAFLAEAAARAGVPWRINLEYFDPFLDDRRPAPPFTHEGWIFWGAEASPRSLLYLLDPLGGLGGPGGFPPESRVRFPLAPEAHPRARTLLSRAGLAGRSLAVLCPGGKSSVRWPAGHFAELADRLGRELGWGIVLSGSPTEAELLAEIAHRIREPLPAPPLVFTGPLDELAALLGVARLLVGNDSAPIHLGEALGTPTLYFAQREKLAHSQPRHPAVLALYDDTANDLTRITPSQAMGAILAELAILSPWRRTSS